MRSERFEEILAEGVRNSLGRVSEVIDIVLRDETHLDELYGCMFNGDEWVRMRAADAFEKICREHPEWIARYIDRIQVELAQSSQPSIQWHMAQIYRQVNLNAQQMKHAIDWMLALASTTDVDWIVAADVMTTLVDFAGRGDVPKGRVLAVLDTQSHHKSKSVVKKSQKLRALLG